MVRLGAVPSLRHYVENAGPANKRLVLAKPNHYGAFGPSVIDRLCSTAAERCLAPTVRTGWLSTRLRPLKSNLVPPSSRPLRGRFGRPATLARHTTRTAQLLRGCSMLRVGSMLSFSRRNVNPSRHDDPLHRTSRTSSCASQPRLPRACESAYASPTRRGRLRKSRQGRSLRGVHPSACGLGSDTEIRRATKRGTLK